ncbi:hypothetical protein VP01_3493g3 [Puccinia sorghi]|uniref:Uncharacterized protein n=1 Tax=Puccinia sorghi TaxID=27349 RepID=A0A0L6UVR2_9BASI|nr:hypothetical protein VP01_3493g3 [Puccinia sorghi]
MQLCYHNTCAMRSCRRLFEGVNSSSIVKLQTLDVLTINSASRIKLHCDAGTPQTPNQVKIICVVATTHLMWKIIYQSNSVDQFYFNKNGSFCPDVLLNLLKLGEKSTGKIWVRMIYVLTMNMLFYSQMNRTSCSKNKTWTFIMRIERKIKKSDIQFVAVIHEMKNNQFERAQKVSMNVWYYLLGLGLGGRLQHEIIVEKSWKKIFDRVKFNLGFRFGGVRPSLVERCGIFVENVKPGWTKWSLNDWMCLAMKDTWGKCVHHYMLKVFYLHNAGVWNGPKGIFGLIASCPHSSSITAVPANHNVVRLVPLKKRNFFDSIWRAGSSSVAQFSYGFSSSGEMKRHFSRTSAWTKGPIHNIEEDPQNHKKIRMSTLISYFLTTTDSVKLVIEHLYTSIFLFTHLFCTFPSLGKMPYCFSFPIRSFFCAKRPACHTIKTPPFRALYQHLCFFPRHLSSVNLLLVSITDSHVILPYLPIHSSNLSGSKTKPISRKFPNTRTSLDRKEALISAKLASNYIISKVPQYVTGICWNCENRWDSYVNLVDCSVGRVNFSLLVLFCHTTNPTEDNLDLGQWLLARIRCKIHNINQLRKKNKNEESKRAYICKGVYKLKYETEAEERVDSKILRDYCCTGRLSYCRASRKRKDLKSRFAFNSTNVELSLVECLTSKWISRSEPRTLMRDTACSYSLSPINLSFPTGQPLLATQIAANPPLSAAPPLICPSPASHLPTARLLHTFVHYPVSNLLSQSKHIANSQNTLNILK